MWWANKIVEWLSSPETLKSVENVRLPFWIFSKNRWPTSPATFILRPWSAPAGEDLAPFLQEMHKLSTNTLWNLKESNLENLGMRLEGKAPI